MKKVIGVIILVSTLLASCSNESDASYGRLKELGSEIIGGADITIFKDSETGCQYMIHYAASITPVLDKDGKPYCK